MDLLQIKMLMDLLAASSLDEIEARRGGLRIRLAKGLAMAGDGKAESAPYYAPGENRAALASTNERVQTSIVSPMFATFHRAASPRDRPFVAEGDTVAIAQTVGLLEAMKTLMPLTSDKAGTIESILVRDGVVVDEGQPIFLLR